MLLLFAYYALSSIWKHYLSIIPEQYDAKTVIKNESKILLKCTYDNYVTSQICIIMKSVDINHSVVLQIWCGKMRDEEALHKIRTSVHSPGPIRRVLGVGGWRLLAWGRGMGGLIIID